jgi:hypothetical protein
MREGTIESFEAASPERQRGATFSLEFAGKLESASGIQADEISEQKSVLSGLIRNTNSLFNQEIGHPNSHGAAAQQNYVPFRVRAGDRNRALTGRGPWRIIDNSDC